MCSRYSASGMNNEEFFGDVLYEISHRAMIEAGEIVQPLFHSISISNNDSDEYNNTNMLVKVITESFTEHDKVIKEKCYLSDKIGTKVLVTLQGSKQLTELYNDPNFKHWCTHNNINVLSVSSNTELKDKFNFKKLSRAKVINELNNLTNEDNAIILHIDILAEGIDLPGITGILPIRELAYSKLQQTLGRASRLHIHDRMNLYNGVIKPTNRNKMAKPYCYILLSEDLFLGKDSSSKIFENIDRLRSSYNIPVEEVSIVDKFRGISEDELPPLPPEESPVSNSGVECDLIHIIENDFQIVDRFEENINTQTDPIGYILSNLLSMETE